MAYTAFAANDPETNKVFAQDLNRVILKRVEFMSLASADTSAGAIEIRDELQKAAGDLIYTFLEFQLAPGGRYGFEPLENFENKLESARDSFLIDTTRKAVKRVGKISDQRVPWDFRKRARNALSDWFADYYDRAWGWILGGLETTATAVTGAVVPTATGDTLHNATTAPTRKQWTDSGITADQSLTTGDEFNVGCIDRAVTKAQVADIPIRPFRVEGQDVYVQVIHPNDLAALRTATTGVWYDIQKQLIAGGYAMDNPLFRGTVGMWNGTIIKVSTRVSPAMNASTSAALPNARRCPFLGAQAGIMGFGRGEGPTRYNWEEEKFDYKDTMGIAASTIVGGKKAVYTPPGGSATDLGVLVTSTYAPAPV